MTFMVLEACPEGCDGGSVDAEGIVVRDVTIGEQPLLVDDDVAHLPDPSELRFLPDSAFCHGFSLQLEASFFVFS